MTSARGMPLLPYDLGQEEVEAVAPIIVLNE